MNQARDSDNHSIQEVVVKQQDRVNIRPSKSGDLHIKQMVIVDNVLETYDGDPIDIIAVPGRIEAISVVNRGVAFTPPNAHNGQPIKRHKDPIEIAELGIE
ncbi:hypothetical protein AB4Z50_36280, partial [Paenibacillus sp. 2TAB26]|uniref:hypothetical protein n=1 Tax=Paenibacillus sp. 2TAB26 TaxID=3233005 RepID=UPI003F9B6FBE